MGERGQRKGSRVRGTGLGTAGWITAAVGTVSGWLLVSAGLGLGIPRASGPPSVSGGAAAVALVCGVVLLVIGALGLAGATRGWGRLLFVPWAVVVVVPVYALSIACAASFPPRPPLDADLPPGARTVEMVTADGVTLEGWYFPSADGAAVVVRHGAGSTRADVLDQAQVLVDAGYGVLVVDARGHGGSGGRGMDFGWHGEADTRAAVDFLVALPEVDPERIAVLGLSMGGEEAIGAAAEDDRIGAVVAEGATGRTAADKQWLAEEYGAAGVLQGLLDRITYGLVEVMTGTRPPRPLGEAIRASGSTPFLLIAGGDVADEVSVSERFRAVDADRVEVWVVPASGHIDGLATEPDEWRARVVSFLDEALTAAPFD